MVRGISFVIPCYNEEKHIFKCIRCIHEEMVNYWPHIKYEVIVIDNNSTDHTVEEAVRAVCWLDKEERPGVVWSRQKGFEISDYDLVAFIDADNEMPKFWVKEALETFKKSDDIVAVSGTLRFYDAPKRYNTASAIFYRIAKALHPLWPTIQGGNFILKKSALEKVGGFDTSYDFWGEDTRTAVLLSQVGKIILNPRLVINTSYRRLKNQGTFNTTWTYILNYLSVNLRGKPTKHKEYKNYR